MSGKAKRKVKIKSDVSLRDYFRQNVEKKLIKQMPEDVLKQTTPATELLEKKKELAEVEDALEAQKEDFRLRMESLKQRRAELERKEYQLQENLLKFDRFLKENDARRERAERKAQEESEVADQREHEIASLTEQLHTLKDTKQRQKEIIARYQKFEDFLKQVLTKSGEFAEISELIDRHATLIATNKDLRERERENQALMDKLKQEAAVFREENRVHILKCNNKLSVLQVEKEKAQTEKLYWENQFTQVQNAASKRTLLLGQIKLATNNLFMLIQRKAKLNTTEATPTQQLEKIQHYIQDLQDIIAEYEEGLLED
ncbi:hypothetical protein PTSG_08113 [Salpingoeca rosetta]|uniref:DUF4200 domain-containing protein n=1 Tax=Salpingoeca rosetta (strain ATCC 50818 / BSB-021) TaxID=946362 RepID=F2UI12_SALR5|nr:uncharacterized protein PTSG_08113 [Salpingoeca rosetta]EGD76761.1 hypothetical protein PTSG_08113 [Salpingoeca rosetta]|eukprot:XP_004991133.1 hypothetical protein PTSG_08113 [Salpingoeca rosetta]